MSVFFFQAEDGIRDLVRSRGLGDVYKRQIREWDFKPTAKNNYHSGEISIGKIDEPGIYIVQAIRNEIVGYCAIVVTDYAMVYKNNQKEVLAFIANAKTGEFSTKARFDFYQDGKQIGSKLTDKDLSLIHI